MKESLDTDFTNHTPMMQQYHFLIFNLLKYKHKFVTTLILVY